MHSRFSLIGGRASSKALFASVLVGAVLYGCSGSSSVVVPAQNELATAGNAATSPAMRRGDTKLRMSVLVPRRHHGTRAHYVSASTQSIIVTEGTLRLTPFNTVAPSAQCSVQNNGTLCVFALQVLSGVNETFVINTYDQENGEGNLLSSGAITQTIHRGKLNIMALTLEGIPQSIDLVIQGSQLSAGTAATTALSVMAKDADGNVIVGAGSYDNPIAITATGALGTVTVSPSTVTAPNQAVTLSYNGKSIDTVTIGASSAGVVSQNIAGATFAPKPTVIADFSVLMPAARRAPHASAHRRPLSSPQQQPSAIINGPDGNLWGAVASTKPGLVRVSTSGVQTFFQAGQPPSTNLPVAVITGLATGSDGKVWYADSGSIGYIDPASGIVTDYPLGSVSGICAAASAVRIAAAPASYGGVWATLRCASDSQLVHVASDGNGTMTFYSLTGFVSPNGLVVGSDGNIYVAGQVGANTDAAIAQAVVLNGAVVSSSFIDIASLSNLGLVGIAQSADGDIWATTGSCAPSAFIRLHAPSGFSAAVPDVFTTLGCSRPYYLTALPDGTLWAPDNAYAGAARIAPGIYPAAPVQFDLLLPTPGGVSGSEYDVALGPDGDLYFSDDSSTSTTTGDIAKVAY